MNPIEENMLQKYVERALFTINVLTQAKNCIQDPKLSWQDKQMAMHAINAAYNVLESVERD
jgi:hypothetical protein